MGLRGPKASEAGITRQGWTFYPDRESARIIAKHLAAMKSRNPRARLTKNQVLRLIIRQADDDEWLGFVLEIQERVAQAKMAQEEAGRREAEARRRIEELLQVVMALEERRGKTSHPDVQTALRALRVPTNNGIRANLNALQTAEEAGKALPDAIPALALARRHLASYRDLDDLLGGGSS